MKFDYDKRKSNANKKKHGIDFDEAQLLWDDKYLAKLPSKQNVVEETRFLHIGLIGAIHWTAITTHRDPNLIRIISVRRSRKQEVLIYES